MSHFTLLVVAKDEDELGKKLAPYDEQNEDFFEFEAVDMDEAEQLARSIITKNDFPYLWRAYPEVRNQPILPSIYDNDFKKFMEDYYGTRWHEEAQAYGFQSNPNAKLDWYVIGGRWSGEIFGTEDNFGPASVVKAIPREASDGPPVFALIDREGNWFQKGEIRWFGHVEEKDVSAFTKIFWQKIDELDDTERLYLIDCHI